MHINNDQGCQVRAHRQDLVRVRVTVALRRKPRDVKLRGCCQAPITFRATVPCVGSDRTEMESALERRVVVGW